MAAMLENISSIKIIARTTIAAVYRTSEIIASLPNHSYRNKARDTIYIFFRVKLKQSLCNCPVSFTLTKGTFNKNLENG